MLNRWEYRIGAKLEAIQYCHSKEVANFDVANFDSASLTSKNDHLREEFQKSLPKGPPQKFRVIDCKSTMKEGKVVLIGWNEMVGYTAVSHTFGMEVYRVFNCACATKCFAKSPRRSEEPCPGHDHVEGDKHSQVCRDILAMCGILMAAGAETVWHDGVCIAQHDEAEVEEAIRHMGWIYANAKDTVIFLHYVGTPMAPIRHDADLVSRWHTRVWTLQEAAVSRRRRYCVRVGGNGNLGYCQSLEELEAEIASWYEDDSNIAVIEEDQFWKLVVQLSSVVGRLLVEDTLNISKVMFKKASKWQSCLINWQGTLVDTCFCFPTLDSVLRRCSTRDSKHEGDRINSILGLTGVTDFVAPKDGNLETSTITFFQRLGQKGLAQAVFSANRRWKDEPGKLHSWVPSLSRQLVAKGFRMVSPDFIRYEVLGNGMLQLTGELMCVETVQMTTRSTVQSSEECSGQQSDLVHGRLAMDLSFDLHQNAFISFAPASTTELGKAVLSRSFDGEPMLQQEGVIKEGESFCAHLVFARGALKCNPITNLADPCLLVKGDLRAPVSKLGFFYIYEALLDILLLDTTPITKLDELIIM